ncbi:MAG: glycosyl-4,4'-diaponeurosporenoate acyltransferase [Phycisphaerae bacterium]|nr:glycosyl-4,4'-diaponeurosporenoate acyltransferase [Phycisphaerae bacterium]
MPIELPARWVVVLNVGGWLVLQLALAWAFTQMPARWFRPVPPSAWENGGRFYERFVAVRRWKGLLPDGARWFAGGFGKATLVGVNPEYLQRFLRETRRGELCHWFAISGAPVFFLWNPWWGDVIIIAYALAANLPCILTQRYNRTRLFRLIGRVRRHAGRQGKTML